MPKNRVSSHAFRELAYGWSSRELAAELGVSARTVKRWKAGTSAPPPAAVRLVELVTAGELGAVHAAWRGWRLARDGLLYGPHSRRGVAPQDIAALHWLRQVAAWREAAARKTSSPIAAAYGVRSDGSIPPIAAGYSAKSGRRP